MSGYFITGTDTGVGKTLVTAAIIQSLSHAGIKVVGMKPVASGCRVTDSGLRNKDAERLIAQSSISAPYEMVNPYAFEPAIAPHLAAREANIRIKLETILDCFESLAALADTVVVEGVGGWRVPLGRAITTEHMAKALNLPVILVVGMRLGCINHALLTVQAIESAGLKLSGWVANRLDVDMVKPEASISTLESYITAPLIGQIPFMEQPEPELIESHLHLDWLTKT